ncbi:TRAFAC clade GTPase domain-containing protein [Sorangium sp. So ce1182]|uniref:TRAFAC clade GTPase domain-containing protein n=1 Tax=Sorangium sp. So ce1182 TaxID=3133334 RepID=UPI003F5EC9E1
MSDSVPTHLLFVGLPGSGKTTFLAALWHVLDDQSSTTSLKLTRLSGDRTYLNRIAEAWRSCSPIGRTTLQTEEVVSLHLEGDGFGAFELAVPDLSGEAFELQLTERRISARYDELVQQATGVILFVHPDVQKGTPLTQALQLEASISGAAAQPSPSADGNAGTVVPWSVEKVPTQVKLVELLQFLLERAPRKVRVAVVISAWDLVEKFGVPHDFVSREMPLLRQFLDSNNDVLENAIFGVSAQGGTIPDDKFTLLSIDALERIKVYQGDILNHDITKPIVWLLGAR